jgi:tetratricopeptide (TPR) repeat protein
VGILFLIITLALGKEQLSTVVHRLLAQSNYQEARLLLEEHLRKNPDRSDYYILLSEVWCAEGKYSNAFRVIVKAYEYFPSNPYVAKELADVYRSLGEYKKALALYRQGLPEIPEKHKPLWYYGMGVCYYELSEYDKALRFLQEALKGKIAFWPLYYLGKTYLEQERFDEACWAFERAELQLHFQATWATNLFYYAWGTARLEQALRIRATNTLVARSTFEALLHDNRFSDRRIRERVEFWLKRL